MASGRTVELAVKIIRRYWFDAIVECGWKKGSSWRKARGGGSLTDSDEILEIDPPRRLVIRWQGEWKPEFKAEGPSRCTFALEPMDGAVKLASTHEIERAESKFIAALCEGWPLVLSNLKSLLETGEVALTTHAVAPSPSDRSRFAIGLNRSC